MQFIDYVRTAQTNLTRSRLRTVLTVLAILVGTFTLTLTTALGEGIRSYVSQQITAEAQPDTAVIYGRINENSPFNSNQSVAEYDPNKGTAGSNRSVITQADLDSVVAMPNITGAWFGRSIATEYIQHDSGKKYVASIDSLYAMTKLDFAAGSMPSVDDQSAYVLPYQYVQPLGFSSPADAIGKTVTVHFVEQVVPITKPGVTPPAPKSEDKTFTIRAVLVNSAVKQNAYISYLAVDEISAFQFGTNQSPSVIVAGTKPGMTKTESETLKKALTDKGYEVFMYQDAIAQFTKAISIIQLSLGGFAGIALLAAMIGIVNTLLMAAIERTSEIGLWKALGMRRRGIFGAFLYEALSIGFWGGIIGVLLAYGAGSIINPILKRTVLNNLEGFTLLAFRWEYMLGVVVLAMFIGLIAGVLPAIRASRLDPINALRHE